MPFTQVRDLQLYYEIQGQGPNLLFISGTGGDLRVKPNVFASPLANHFTILAYDQRGLGQTDKPDVPYAMADYAADADVLLQAVGWNSALVMGVSFGGMVGQELAIRYPQRVQKLVLACTSSGGTGGASYPLHTLRDLPPAMRAERLIALADTRITADWQAAHPDEYAQMIAESTERYTAGKDDPVQQRGAWLQLEARKNHDTYDRLPNLKMPVFICGGHYDGIVPIANLEVTQAQISGSRLALFEGGHQFLQQDPHAYQQVIAFLKASSGN